MIGMGKERFGRREERPRPACKALWLGTGIPYDLADGTDGKRL